jgi:hypothetical protein
MPSGIDDVRYPREFRRHCRRGTSSLSIDLADGYETRNYVRLAPQRVSDRVLPHGNHLIVIFSGHKVKMVSITLFIGKGTS